MNKKRTEKGEDEVMVCVDNDGMDDRFDVGIEYLVEDHKDKTLIYAYDKLSKKGEFFKKRFLTPEQWEQKQGKIVVKNRESSEDEKDQVVKEIQAGDKIRAINNAQLKIFTGIVFDKTMGVVIFLLLSFLLSVLLLAMGERNTTQKYIAWWILVIVHGSMALVYLSIVANKSFCWMRRQWRIAGEQALVKKCKTV